MNPFQTGDVVDTGPQATTARANGRVKYIACHGATSKGGKICSYKNCLHQTRDYVWVEWGTAGTFSYHYSELILSLTMAIGQATTGWAASPASIPTNSPVPANPQDLSLEKETLQMADSVVNEFKQAVKTFRSQPLNKGEVDWDVYYHGKSKDGRFKFPNYYRKTE